MKHWIAPVLLGLGLAMATGQHARADSSRSLGVGTGVQLVDDDDDRRGRDWRRGWNNNGWHGRDWDDDWRHGWRDDRRDRRWSYKKHRPYYGYGGYGHDRNRFSTFFYIPLGTFGAPPPPAVVHRSRTAAPCVEYRGDAVNDATGEPFYGVACLGGDGRWHIVD